MSKTIKRNVCCFFFTLQSSKNLNLYEIDNFISFEVILLLVKEGLVFMAVFVASDIFRQQLFFFFVIVYLIQNI